MTLDIYDGECRERYGSKTCILFESNGKFNTRFLDCQTSLCPEVKKNELFIYVPQLIGEKYTVVIVENKGITAVHLPAQSHLVSPPIIQ